MLRPNAPNSKISSAVFCAVRQQRPQEHFLQRPGVEERLVRLARLRPVARVRRKHLAGDLFRHFESEAEARRRLAEQFAPEIFRGELVEGEIAAHRGERLGVFPQALGLEEPLEKRPRER